MFYKFLKYEIFYLLMLILFTKNSISQNFTNTNTNKCLYGYNGDYCDGKIKINMLITIFCIFNLIYKSKI